MSLDLFTTINIYMFVNYICTFTLGVAWFRIKNKYDGILYIFIDFLFQSIGLTLASLKLILPEIISVVLANVLMFIGAIFFLYGLGLFTKVKIPKFPYVIVALIFTSLYALFTFSFPDMKMRLIIFTSMILPVLFNNIYIILFKADKIYQKFSLHVVIALFLLMLVHGSRMVFGLIHFPLKDYQNLHQLESYLIIASLLCTIYLTFSVTQMIHMKLLYELDESAKQTKNLLLKTEKLAITDGLTGLYNRRKIEEKIQSRISEYMKNKLSFSILLLDIDHFKRFNDTYGHDVGDKVIIEVSSLLKNCLNDGDEIGRWGGEEFLVLLGNEDMLEAKKKSFNIIKRISEHDLNLAGYNEKLTISGGFVEMTEDYNLNKLIKLADNALYKAKEKGRNRLETGF